MHAGDTKPLNEIEEVWAHCVHRTLDDCVDVRILMINKVTHACVVDIHTDEILALVCMPPFRMYDVNKAN